MSILKLKGSTSGYVELTAPATAGNNTITLPVTAGTVAVRDASNNTEVGTGVTVGSPSSNTFTVSTAGSERIRIDSSGRMGLGTASPSFAFDVQSGDVRIKRSATNDAAIYFGTNVDNYIYSGNANNIFSLATNGAERLRIDSSGRLLVGTSSSGGLTCRAVFQGNSFSSTGDAVIKLSRGENAPISGAALGLLEFTDSGYSAAAFIGAYRDGGTWTSGSSQPTRLVFSTTADGGSSPTERMRITSAGLMGLGTTSPSTRLHVASSVSTLPSAEDYTTTVGYFNNTYSNTTNGATAYTVLRLRREGEGGVAYASCADFAIARYEASGTNSRTRLDLRLGHAGTNTTDTTVMSLLSSGALGVGTTSPSSPINTARLMIQGGDLVIRDDNSGNNWNRGTIVFDIRNSNGDSKSAYIQSNKVADVSSTLQFFTTATHSLSERMRIDDAGRLLVGTSSYSGNATIVVQGYAGTSTGPAHLLLKRGTTTIGDGEDFGYLFFSDGNASGGFGAWIVGQRDGGTWTSGSSMPGRLVFSTTANGASVPTERMRLASNGDLTCPGVYSNTTATAANVVVSTSPYYILRSTSSIKYKTNVEDIDPAYSAKLLNCRPVWFRSTCSIDNPDWSHWGFIAEEVASIDPRLVHWKTKDRITQEDGTQVDIELETPEPEGVQYDRFVPHLLNLIKQQQQAIEDLQAKVAALESA